MLKAFLIIINKRKEKKNDRFHNWGNKIWGKVKGSYGCNWRSNRVHWWDLKGKNSAKGGDKKMIMEKDKKDKDWLEIAEAIATIALMFIGGIKTLKKK